MTSEAAPISTFIDGVQVVWDSTSLTLWQTCPYKYYLTRYEGWAHKQKSVHLLFGGIYASALERYYKLVGTGTDPEAALRAVVRFALEESWDHEAGQPKEFLDNKKTRDALLRTIIWYFDEFADDQLETLTLPDGTLGVELTFKVPFTDNILYVGHLDRAVMFEGNPYIFDQKTTKSVITPYYWGQFSPNNQVSAYSLAGQIVYKMPFRGMVIDAAQINVNSTVFERSPIPRSAASLDEWYTNTVRVIEGAQRDMEARFFPMNPASCGNYGGCEFRKICALSPEFRERFLLESYAKHTPWDPLGRDGN